MSRIPDPKKPKTEIPQPSPLDSMEQESPIRPLLILAVPMLLLVLYGVLAD